jgi:hypothetical protein
MSRSTEWLSVELFPAFLRRYVSFKARPRTESNTCDAGTGNKGERSKFIPPAIWGLTKDYPEAAKWLNDNLIPERASEFRRALTSCFDTTEVLFSHLDIGMYLKRGYDAMFSDPVMKKVIDQAGGFLSSGYDRQTAN